MAVDKIRGRLTRIRPITRLAFAGYILAATLLAPVEGWVAAVVNVGQSVLCGYLAFESGRQIYLRFGWWLAILFSLFVVAVWVLIKGIWLVPDVI